MQSLRAFSCTSLCVEFLIVSIHVWRKWQDFIKCCLFNEFRRVCTYFERHQIFVYSQTLIWLFQQERIFVIFGLLFGYLSRKGSLSCNTCRDFIKWWLFNYFRWVHIYFKWHQIFVYTKTLIWSFEQEGSFIVSHMPWHRTSGI